MVDRKRFAGTTILVVDDDDGIRVLLQAVFRRMGADVALAADGSEALAKLAQPPDLLILDLFMPTVTGFEVLEHLRVHQPALLARTLIITAGPRGVDALLGSLPVLHKPFDLERFIEMLEHCLDGPMPTLGPLDNWQARLRRKPTSARRTAVATAPEGARARGGHRFTSETARIAGRKGGDAVSRDRAHMATIGRKGAKAKAARARNPIQ